MRAAVLNAQHTFDIVTVDDPVPGAGEMVLAVGACGICGSDLKAAPHFPVGYTMGHEFAGEVVAIGAGVEGWSVGDHACALPLTGCGQCSWCRSGYTAHCPSMQMIGTGAIPGAYAEYVRVSAAESFPLPAGVDDRLGALVEPLAVGLHTLDRAGLRHGERVLVLGGGPVGLAVTAWARLLGAREIVVSDPVAGRRAHAERLGATAVLDPSTVHDMAATVAAAAGAAPDLVVEAVGRPGMIQAAIDAAPVHGRVVVAGVCSSPDTIVPISAVMKELRIDHAVYYRRGDFAETLAMLDAGRLDPTSMVSDIVDLDAFPAAFEALKSPVDQGKVLVTPR